MRLKNHLFFVLVFCLLIISNTISDEITITPTSESASSNHEIGANENIAGTKEDGLNNNDSPILPESSGDDKTLIKNVNSIAKDSVKESFLGIGTNQSHENPIILIPDYLERPTRILFKIADSEQITLERLIILSLLFICFLITMYSVFNDIFDRRLVVFSVALIISLIVSYIGIINRFGNFYLSLFEDLSILYNSLIISLISILIYFIITFIITLIVIPLIKKAANKGGVEESERQGAILGLWAKIARRKAKSESNNRLFL
jgi:hypothetical protein